MKEEGVVFRNSKHSEKSNKQFKSKGSSNFALNKRVLLILGLR